jgi:hypothetical protein
VRQGGVPMKNLELNQTAYASRYTDPDFREVIR